MTFQQPLVLLLLLALPALVAGVVRWRRRRPARGVPHPSLDLVAMADPGPRPRRHLPLALAVLAVAALTVALARPEAWRDEPRERATIMLAVDVSGSMAATDVEPYRLSAAQAAAKQFLEEVPRRYRVGLVSFSGRASVLVPPTNDRASVERAVEGLTPEGATAVGEAVVAALDAMRGAQPGSEDGRPLDAARILLLSDGASTTGVLTSEAADEAAEAGVPVYTVSLGTQDGILPNGTRVPPDVTGMRALADATDGEAFESEDAESVSEVYEHLGSFIGTERVRGEVTAWPAGAGALLLALAGAAAWRLGPRLS